MTPDTPNISRASDFCTFYSWSSLRAWTWVTLWRKRRKKLCSVLEIFWCTWPEEMWDSSLHFRFCRSIFIKAQNTASASFSKYLPPRPVSSFLLPAFQMAQDSLQCAGQVCDPLLGLSEGRDPGSAARGRHCCQHRWRHCVWDPAAGWGCIWGTTNFHILSTWLGFGKIYDNRFIHSQQNISHFGLF